MTRRYSFSKGERARGFFEVDGDPQAPRLSGDPDTIELVDAMRSKRVHTPYGLEAGDEVEPPSVFWFERIAERIAERMSWELEALGDALPKTPELSPFDVH